MPAEPGSSISVVSVAEPGNQKVEAGSATAEAISARALRLAFQRKRKKGMSRFITAVLLVGISASTTLGQVPEGHSPEGGGGSPVIALVLGGSSGALAGLLLGGLVGAGLQSCSYPDAEGDNCGLSGFTTGAFVGSAVGSVLGIQVAGNLFDDRPSIAWSLIGTVTGFAGGCLAAWAMNEWGGVDGEPLFVGFSVSQGAMAGALVALVERSGAR